MHGSVVRDADAVGCIGEEGFCQGHRVKGEDEVRLFLDDADYGPVGGKCSDLSELQEVLDGRRGFSEEVNEVGFQLGEVFGGLASCEASVHIHSLLIGGDVVAWYVAVELQFEMSDGPGGFGLAAELADGRGEERAVELISDSIDVAALFEADDVAGAADFQVAKGDPKPRTQLAELLYGL